MQSFKRLAAPFALAAAISLPGGQAPACAFHTYLPERTVVDMLLETENVILARPDPENPFRFTAVAALEGTLEQAALPTLVDSTTRRKMSANPDDVVLFARDGGGYGPFVRLAYLDGPYREIVETIMERKEDWVMGDDLGRYQFFADLLSHSDPTIRALALRELDTAPYDLLRAVDLSVDAGAILRDLWQIYEAPYVPIRLLLLGLSDSDAARAEIRRGLETERLRPTGFRLGPLATALVELDGAEGIAELETLFLSEPDASAEAQELVVEALAIHAVSSTPEMRERIISALADFATLRPDRADAVARQFQIRYDFGMADALAELLESGTIRSAKVLIPVSTYVMMARQDQTMMTEFQ
ncbi:hypothetical protein [Tropicimonas aquimaris]|uniref:HEAT repeat domain-containing protein n=1 Tax=Tropicimonas aquimaris TaxID=914152 RepID=A0ABW3IUT0_9RHOB